MSNQVTNSSTIQADIRKIANGCDIGEMNLEFFLKATFIMNIVQYVQKKEEEAFARGLQSSHELND